jgi:hypothetical protein
LVLRPTTPGLFSYKAAVPCPKSTFSGEDTRLRHVQGVHNGRLFFLISRAAGFAAGLVIAGVSLFG